MDDFISIDKLIKQAKSKGVNFGTGDPYNRLRYYTKIGWLPHMVRKADKTGNIKGHYPQSSLQTLVIIEDLKSQGATNEEIAKKLENKSKKEGILNLIKSPEIKKQLVTYATLLILLLIFINEIGIINLGKANRTVNQDINSYEQIYASGTSFVPKNQNKIFISFRDLKPNSKVYVTFTQNYSPATRYWVSKIDQQNGFLVELDAPVATNVEFNWWLSL
jgi:DNA-binding transcriptional MerR regulator